jgi:cathepsin L
MEITENGQYQHCCNFCFINYQMQLRHVLPSGNKILIHFSTIFRGMNGCDGADPGAYINFFANSLHGQSVHEVNYPYLDRNPKLTCPQGKSIYNSGASVNTALVDNSCNEDKLKTLVATYGAVVVAIYASDRAFNNYANGVFNGCSSQSANHAVLVVGYGTDAASGLDYWLVKNSWGASWGQNGFIKMQVPLL